MSMTSVVERLRKIDNATGRLLTGSLPLAAAAAEEIERLQTERDKLYGYVNGLLGLLQLLRGRDDIPAEVKEIMRTNHRAVDAAAYLTQIVPPVEGRPITSTQCEKPK